MPLLALSVLWWIFLVCLLMGLGFWMLFAWSVRAGQFDDPERAAAEMLEHEQDEFAPADTILADGALKDGSSQDESSQDRSSKDRVEGKQP